MHRYVGAFSVLVICCTLVGCNKKQSLPEDAAQALVKSKDFELYSLSPKPPEKDDKSDKLQGWKILGKTKVTDADVRKKLISKFEAGVAENDGTVAGCFNPRHGIRVKHKGKVYDFVICFECYQVSRYIDGKRVDGFLITDSPQATFDKVLKDAKIPLAK